MSRDARYKRREIETARREKVSSLMREYDDTVFYPALDAIKAECATAGHGAKHYHNNGLGWVFTSCIDCGAMLAKDGPDGESIKGQHQ